jgi:hypothetical protein
MTRSTLLFLSFTVAACGGRVEQIVLRGYFDLCAAADDVALANVATAVLDPRRDGVVGHFEILSVTELPRPDSSHPQLAQLSLLPHTAPPGPERSPTVVTRQVELTADVHRDGHVRRTPLTVTLARADLGETRGRWIVIRLVLDGRTLPAASFDPRSGTAP